MIDRQNYQPAGLAVRNLSGHTLYSHVVSVGTGRTIYVSGQLARDETGEIVGVGDMAAQIEQVGKNIATCLAAAGATLADLVKTTTYVTDIDLFFKYPEIRARFFGPALPTSTTVEVRRLSHPDFLVEIDAVAIVAADR
jgi:enamine deaminase RidA (YjgF/YER057c/UK114 family)